MSGSGAIYDIVRKEIDFGYNRSGDIRDSQVLADGFGQCNTKGTLLMAPLRGADVRCSLHGFTIYHALQRGGLPEFVYPVAPAEIVHSLVEVETAGGWVNLEGFILDSRYLASLQRAFRGTESLCGYGVGTDCPSAPLVEWTGDDTNIQKSGIARNFGTLNTPDAFYPGDGQDSSLLRDTSCVTG